MEPIRPVSDHTFLALYAACHFLVHIPSRVLAALIIVILQYFNLTLVQYGLIATVVGFAEGFCSPLCGILADRFNKSRFPPLSIVITGGATLIIGLFGTLSIYLFVSCLLVLSLTSALFHTPGMTLISERFQKGRSKAFSVFSIGGQAGMGAGPLTIAILMWLDEGQLHDPFLAYLLWSVPLLVISVVMVITHAKDPTIGVGTELKTRVTPKKKGSAPSSFSSAKALLISSFLILLLITSLLGFGRKLFDQYLVYFLVEARQVSQATAVFYYSMLTILGLPGNLLGGLAGDRYGEKRVLMMAHTLTVLGLSVLLLLQDAVFLPLVVLLLACGKNVAMPNSHSLTAKIVPLKARGKAYGLIRWDTTALGSIAPTVGAAIILQINAMAIFLISIGLFALSIVLFLFIRETSDTEPISNTN